MSCPIYWPRQDGSLEKAQVAESILEELKERYRGLRRQEEHGFRDVADAGMDTEEELRHLDTQAERLR